MRVTGDGGVGIEVFLDGPEDGPPVLFMHGWPDSHDLWRHQVAALAEAGHRTIAPDLRGFGASDRPAETEAYRLQHTVVDMLAVLDALGVERTAVVAHDWGAAAAWGLVGFVPDRVERFAALSVGHPKAFRAAGFEQLMRSWYMLLFQFPGVAEAWLDRFGSVLLGSHPDREAVLASWQDRERMTAGLQWYRANANPKSLIKDVPDIPPAQCPVLGVWSSGDAALAESGMTASESYVDGPWRYVRIDGASHWMQLDATDELNRLLVEFLAVTT